MENIHMSNQPKKIEKNKIKSTDLLKETTKNSYSKYGITNQPLVFEIPIYEGMPASTKLP